MRWTLKQLILAVSVALVGFSLAGCRIEKHYYADPQSSVLGLPAVEESTDQSGSVTKTRHKSYHPTPDGGDENTDTETVTWSGGSYYGLAGALGGSAAPTGGREPMYGRVGGRGTTTQPVRKHWMGSWYKPPR